MHSDQEMVAPLIIQNFHLNVCGRDDGSPSINGDVITHIDERRVNEIVKVELESMIRSPDIHSFRIVTVTDYDKRSKAERSEATRLHMNAPANVQANRLRMSQPANLEATRQRLRQPANVEANRSRKNTPDANAKKASARKRAEDAKKATQTQSDLVDMDAKAYREKCEVDTEI